MERAGQTAARVTAEEVAEVLANLHVTERHSETEARRKTLASVDESILVVIN